MELSIPAIFLSIAVFTAGFIDALAGGGGLITFPAYLHYGLKTELLLGTNKLSSFFGTLIAVIKFFSEIKFRLKDLAFVFILASGGSFLGALLISSIPAFFLKYFLILALPAISIFILSRGEFGLSDFSSFLPSAILKTRLAIIAFSISFYDGLLGPGTGTLFAFAYSKFCGYDLLTATALSKFSNLISNLAALATFLALGRVDIKLGLAMGAVSAAGNFLGSRAALKKGAGFIRPVLFLVSNALLAKIVYDMVK
ncbi:MAG: TSUP family transporter [Elusimicrobiota bacterium]